MLYQLPDGRVISMSVEEFLDLDDQKIQSLIASRHGDRPNSPMYGSAIKGSQREKDYYDRDGLDYTPEDEEENTSGPIDLNNLPEEE